MTNRWVRIAAALLLFGVLWFVAVPDVPRVRLCGFYWLTGRPCPLCGLTRGLLAFAKGHFSQALSFNLLTPLAFLMLFGLFWNTRVVKRLWTAGFWAFAAYGVLRLF